MITTDIWFASFLRLRGFHLKNYMVLSRGKGSFEFSITDDVWKIMKLEFDSSEISKVKHLQASLKDLLY